MIRPVPKFAGRSPDAYHEEGPSSAGRSPDDFPPGSPFPQKGSPRATFHKEKFYGRKIMKDAIDKRNDRERIARSIVKRRNIVYTSQAELDRRRQEEAQKLKQDRTEAAEQLVKQFKDEAKKKQAMEIERLLAEQAMLEKQLETGMDATGKKLMDDVTQERVEAILSEKSKQLESIISANAVQVEQKAAPVEVPVPEENLLHESAGEAEAAQHIVSAAEDSSLDGETDGEPGVSAEEAGSLQEEGVTAE